MKKIVAGLIRLVFGRAIAEREEDWRRFCVKIQRNLNYDHEKNNGWYVNSRHEYVEVS